MPECQLCNKEMKQEGEGYWCAHCGYWIRKPSKEETLKNAIGELGNRLRTDPNSLPIKHKYEVNKMVSLFKDQSGLGREPNKLFKEWAFLVAEAAVENPDKTFNQLIQDKIVLNWVEYFLEKGD